MGKEEYLNSKSPWELITIFKDAGGGVGTLVNCYDNKKYSLPECPKGFSALS